MGSWIDSRQVGGRLWILNPPDTDGQWKVRQHGAFSSPHEALGIRPTEQSCHHVEWRSEQSHHERHDRRIFLKERSAPYYHGTQKGHISDVVSDLSLSS